MGQQKDDTKRPGGRQDEEGKDTELKQNKNGRRKYV